MRTLNIIKEPQSVSSIERNSVQLRTRPRPPTMSAIAPLPDSQVSTRHIILQAPALRALEQACSQLSPPLMERAGQAAYKLACTLLPPASAAKPILVLAGPGNNGGDALVLARHLLQAGYAVQVVCFTTAEQLPADARQALHAWLACGGTLTASDSFTLPAATCPFELIIDGLFGIGLARPVSAPYAEWIEAANAWSAQGRGCPLLALDIPSGLNAETGACMGHTIQATHCASFIALKPGLLTLDGPDHCGEVSVHDLGLQDALKEQPHGRRLQRPDFAHALKPRRHNSHKGSYGSAGIIGGASGMAGAVLLSARASLHLGAGRVYVGMLERLPVDPQQVELMLRSADEIANLADSLLIGPGLGQSVAALTLLTDSLQPKHQDRPLILDADALNLLAANSPLAERLKSRRGSTLLTPHPSEAARLLGCTTAEVQENRLQAALALTHRYHAQVLLKGCGSLIAFSDGRWYINSSGNPGLATAGSGDVLAGMLLALLSQGWPADRALLAATHLHGCAADLCVAEGHGPLGLTAAELIKPARQILNRWIAETTSSKPATLHPGNAQ